MKKILLSAVLCFICALQVSAQNFNEEMLEGTWELQTIGVDFNDYVGPIKKMQLGYIPEDDHGFSLLTGFIEFTWTQKAKELDTSGREFVFEEAENVLDYYITGKDRLHVVVGDDFTLHFKILELTANTMKLKTKKGEITFQKTATSVQNVKAETSFVEKARYNVKGHKLNRPEKGINIIRMADNSSRKELVK